jgi:RimJ/RimL family protein N-acetyltransferase
VRLKDAPHIQRLAGHRQIAATTLNIPHPYGDGVAESWIRRSWVRARKGKSVDLAVVLKSQNVFVGVVSLTINDRHNAAELGYWIGRPYWNQGCCTEAAEALIEFGFETLQLNRIYACYFDNNPASGKVMKKLGMKYEGTLRQHVQKWDRYTDLGFFGILAREYEARRQMGAKR